MRRLLGCALLIAAGLSPAAFAQDVTEINPKNLPQGVSAAGARALLQKAEAAGERDLNAVRARRMQQLRQVHAVTAGARAALKRVFDADKTGTFKNYRADMERIMKLGDKERAAALREVEGKYLSFFQDAFRRANINEADLQARIARILPGAKFGPLLTASGKEPPGPEDREDSPRAHGAPPQNTQTFSEPFGIRSTKRTTQGISVQSASATANLEEGSMSGSVIITLGLGNGRATAAVGQAVDVSSGVRQIRATVATDTGYRLSAVSVLFNGVAGSWADAILEIDKPNGTRLKKTQNLGWVVAPVLWYASESGDDEPLSLSRFAGVPNNAGGQFQIKARVTGEAYTYGVDGGATSFVNSTLKTITVQSIQ